LKDSENVLLRLLRLKVKVNEGNFEIDLLQIAIRDVVKSLVVKRLFTTCVSIHLFLKHVPNMRRFGGMDIEKKSSGA